MLDNFWDKYWITFSGNIPWESNVPDTNLITYLENSNHVKALDVGCGSGINTNFINNLGIEVLGIDVSETAIGLAKSRYPSVNFQVDDILNIQLTDQFDFVFDKGCFHVFDHKYDRQTFAKNVAKLLTEDGIWLSVIGSSEAVHTQSNPPKRTLIEIIEAIDPFLKIEKIVSTYIQTNIHNITDNILTDQGKIHAYAVFSKLRKPK